MMVSTLTVISWGDRKGDKCEWKSLWKWPSITQQSNLAQEINFDNQTSARHCNWTYNLLRSYKRVEKCRLGGEICLPDYLNHQSFQF